MINSAPVDLCFSRWNAISRSTISRLRCRTRAISVVTGLVTTEMGGVVRKVADPPPNLVLVRHAGDIWEGAADPVALDDGGTPPRLRYVPSERLAALPAAQDKGVEVFRSRHGSPHCPRPLGCNARAMS